MKKSFFILLCFTIAYSLSSQAIKDEYIVTLKRGQADRFSAELSSLQGRSASNIKMLSSTLNVVQVYGKSDQDTQLESFLSDNPLVESWGYNYKVTKRKVPSDEFFDMQWSLELIRAPEAWEVTTGGIDFFGRQIVVAVLDDGIDISHPELVNVLYRNEAEIPDDGIDNDNNGYIDDYNGWNPKSEDDEHPTTDFHGTSVCGIIGSETDNDTGVAGINWNVKILPITALGSQADVIAGYQYVLEMRKLYNDTYGEQGAYIVATNYSAGIDNKFGTDPAFQSWCNMYNALGEVGILSTGATANANVNVDEVGDIPTTCPSEYLVTVTNIDVNDTKVEKAGYGALNIDLGAPGRGTFALGSDGGYDESFGGTSSATPHVAGTIALLYSTPCEAIANLAIDNPSMAAQTIRDAVLNGVDNNSTLEDITLTGGRLDILGSMQQIQNICSELSLPAEKGPLNITKINTESSNNIEINYITPDDSPYNIMLTDRSGKTIRHFEFTPPALGRRVIELEIDNIIPGIYFITIYNDSNIKTQKVYIHK